MPSALNSIGSVTLLEVLRARICPLCNRRLLGFFEETIQYYSLRLEAAGSIIVDNHCTVHALLNLVTTKALTHQVALNAIDLLCDPEKAKAYEAIVGLAGIDTAFENLIEELK